MTGPGAPARAAPDDWLPAEGSRSPGAAGIADYEFVRSVGAGPRGQVFLARPPGRLLGAWAPSGLKLDLEVVAVRVYVVPATAATFGQASEELRRVAAVGSPHVLTLLDTGQQRGVFYTAMEYAPGGSLAAPGGQPVTLRAVADAAEGASDLHSAGVVHRGISASNVHLTPDGAKLGDPDLSHLFLPGILMLPGTPAESLEYVDPARLRGEPARPHHDVWSLGVLLHRVITGVGLYPSLPADAVSAWHRVRQSRPQISPALPGHLAPLVRACLSAPSDRPPAGEVARRLRHLTDR